MFHRNTEIFTFITIKVSWQDEELKNLRSLVESYELHFIHINKILYTNVTWQLAAESDMHNPPNKTSTSVCTDLKMCSVF